MPPANTTIQFVSRDQGGMSPGEEMLSDVSDNGLCRSTPITSPYSQTCSSIENADNYTAASPSQFIWKQHFAPIKEDYPLSITGSSNLLRYGLQNTNQNTIIETNYINDPIRNPRNCITPPLPEVAAELARCSEETLLNGDADTDMEICIKKEPQFVCNTPLIPSNGQEPVRHQNQTSQNDTLDEINRQSPFGPTITIKNETPIYHYQATKSEIDEMEQLKWNIQEEVFKRYFDLKQNEPEWGTLEMRNNQLYFIPGKRRRAILTEKKFHEVNCAEGTHDGDTSWYKSRKEQFEVVYREFCCEEARHKSQLHLTRLEKESPFSKFPILANRFLLLRLLGKGGNGEVWDVLDFVDGKKQCALKLSTSNNHAREEHLTHSRLRHPHIVKVGQESWSIEYRQQIYTAFTVDRVSTDLQRLIDTHEYFTEGDAFKVLEQLLKAMTYLHDELGIAHYDLKPSNILISEDECVQLTDFDLARRACEPIATARVGTLQYLPPECFRSSTTGEQGSAEKADMWMIGVVLCMMLWGRHPVFPERTTTIHVKNMLANYNGQIIYHRPVSDVARWIIQSCLHPDFRCRPRAKQILQALENMSNSQA